MAGLIEAGTIRIESPNGLVKKDITVDNSGNPFFNGTQIANTASPTFTGTVELPSTTSIGNVSSTEIGYLDNVTSAIQTQLNAKAPLASPTFTGVPSLPTGTIGVTQTNSVKNTTLATTEYANSLLAEYTVTGSAATSIDITGLDINTHKSYRVEMELINATGSNATIYLFVNGDTTQTNYYRQELTADVGTISASRSNTAQILYLFGSLRSMATFTARLISGYFEATSQGSSGGQTAPWVRLDTFKKVATVTNVTQLTITSSVASSLAVGSTIRIYRGDV